MIYDQAKSSDRGYIIKLNTEGIAGLRTQLGVLRYNRLLEELVQIIGASQKDFDYTALQGANLFYTLLQTKRQQATEIARRTDFLLNHLLHDNLGVAIPSLTSEVFSLHDALTSEVIQTA